MTFDIRDEINRQLIIQIVFFQMLFVLRINDLTVQNLMIIQRNIYNIETQQRLDELSSLIFIQALIREFDVED